jgi:hypothetical protein
MRIDADIDEVLDALTRHMHLNRTQVVEQAILRMGRQEGLIAPPNPIGGVARRDSSAVGRSRVDRFSAAGEEALARIWDTPEEDAAWAHLQGAT